MRYGSVQLASDLRRYGPRIIEPAKFDYRQLLVAIQRPRVTDVALLRDARCVERHVYVAAPRGEEPAALISSS